MKTSILVTGASGFVGGAVAAALVKSGEYDVWYVYRRRDPAIKGARGLVLDLVDGSAYGEYADALSRIELLVHAAATVGEQETDVRSQIVDAALMADNLIGHMPDLRRCVLVSSCSAELVDNEAGFYGLGKLLTEKIMARLCARHGIDYLALRFPQLYGPGEPHNTFVSRFIEAALNHKPLTIINGGSTVRDVLYTADAVGSILYSLTAQRQGVFTICDPTAYTVGQVVEALAEVWAPQRLKIIESSGPAGESVHFVSTAAALGYDITYGLQRGLRETIGKAIHV